MNSDPPRNQRLILTTPSTAKALGDPIRTAILEVIGRGEANVEDIARGLEERGIRKAITTVRHHVDVLKDVGLIELRRTREVKGGVLKYYASNARVLLHEASPEVDAKLAPAMDTAAFLLADVMQKLLRTHPELLEVARELRPCPHCNDAHFLEYVLLRVIERGAAQALAEIQPVADQNVKLGKAKGANKRGA